MGMKGWFTPTRIWPYKLDPKWGQNDCLISFLGTVLKIYPKNYSVSSRFYFSPLRNPFLPDIFVAGRKMAVLCICFSFWSSISNFSFLTVHFSEAEKV